MFDFLLLLARHGLVILGGYLAAHGIADTTSTQGLVFGIAITALVCGWSWLTKVAKFERVWQITPATGEVLKTALGSLISQGITFASAYFACDANNPSALLLAALNAIASHYGVSQQIAHGTPINVASAVKALVACLALLSLSSCAQMNAFFASPQGKATVSFAKLGVDVLAITGEIPPGSSILINEGLAIVTDPKRPGIAKAYDLTAFGLDKAVKAGLVKEGDSLTIQKDAAVIQSALEPVTSAKQPLLITP